MIGAVTPLPGGLGAGLCGVRPPFARLGGIGGGARGFSKLSGVLLGKRGLFGEKRPGVVMEFGVMGYVGVVALEE